MFDVIKKAKKIVILAHQGPDGDAIGSAMAMYYAIKKLGKDVTVILEYIPKCFEFLPHIDKVKQQATKKYDLVICVDSANVERVYGYNDVVDEENLVINIDHHMTNSEYGKYNYVEKDSPACCQTIYQLFKEWNVEITEDIMKAIICGILTDTNGFLYSSVNKTTFEIAAEIREKLEIFPIYNNLIYCKTMPQYKLQKLIMKRLKIYENGQIAFAYLTKNDLKRYHAEKGDYEGLVNIGRNIDGVKVSFLIREVDDGYQVSLRSKDIDVNKIANKFEGGGHKCAAGIKTKMPFFKLKNQLFEEIKKELKK